MSSSRNSSIAAHIIPERASAVQRPAWRQALTQAFTDLPSLLAYLEIDPSALADTAHADRQFALRVPREFAALMRKGDPDDPLLRQVMPDSREMAPIPGFSADPVGDRQAEGSPGLLHKYHGRALIITTGACAVHCRYCFRRHYPYTGGTATPRQWREILDYLKADPSIEEVIFSGGDPLMISDHRLKAWLEQLQGLPQLKRLRLHTRLPVVLPQRITPELTGLLQRCRLRTVTVIHANHPNELSPAVEHGCQKLTEAGTCLLNQSVLLKGVNDDSETLARLSKRLFEIGVMPYYLHLLDRVAGAAHFDLDESVILRLQRQLHAKLPGYLMPKMVREIAGEDSKTPFQSVVELPGSRHTPG
ncbi:MAG: EF-P beta-lysylation protein EpmB [Candidatus Thiodiazotropha sp. (ex Dulcina madagascariensis)]|nr:EF-P beta-lysylation protein EpmB [Candidatus Thiodiazotropha sp. (ex Dulcina madagascariensis)]MCU7927644.1 EF-P beta-lysylation protein EpmB [Candidatus Thiodiazotropha sp. (ex Dulcina madagascariensis)]